MSVEDVERKGVMWKIIGARECSKIGSFGVDAKEKGRKERHGPERQRYSKAAHGQENCKGTAYSSLDNLVWVSII